MAVSLPNTLKGPPSQNSLLLVWNGNEPEYSACWVVPISSYSEHSKGTETALLSTSAEKLIDMFIFFKFNTFVWTFLSLIKQGEKIWCFKIWWNYSFKSMWNQIDIAININIYKICFIREILHNITKIKWVDFSKTELVLFISHLPN